MNIKKYLLEPVVIIAGVVHSGLFFSRESTDAAHVFQYFDVGFSPLYFLLRKMASAFLHIIIPKKGDCRKNEKRCSDENHILLKGVQKRSGEGIWVRWRGRDSYLSLLRDPFLAFRFVCDGSSW